MSLSNSVFVTNLTQLAKILRNRHENDFTPLIAPECLNTLEKIALGLNENNLAHQLTECLVALQATEVNTAGIHESLNSLTLVAAHIGQLASDIETLPPTAEGNLLQKYLLDRFTRLSGAVDNLHTLLDNHSSLLNKD